MYFATFLQKSAFFKLDPLSVASYSERRSGFGIVRRNLEDPLSTPRDLFFRPVFRASIAFDEKHS